MCELGFENVISTSERLHIYRVKYALYSVGAYFCRVSKTKIVTTHDLADNKGKKLSLFVPVVFKISFK